MVATRCPAFSKATRDVKRGGGLPRPALLVAQHDDMRRPGLPLTRLQKHSRLPIVIFGPSPKRIKRNTVGVAHHAESGSAVNRLRDRWRTSPSLLRLPRQHHHQSLQTEYE